MIIICVVGQTRMMTQCGPNLWNDRKSRMHPTALYKQSDFFISLQRLVLASIFLFISLPPAAVFYLESCFPSVAFVSLAELQFDEVVSLMQRRASTCTWRLTRARGVTPPNSPLLSCHLPPLCACTSGTTCMALALEPSRCSLGFVCWTSSVSVSFSDEGAADPFFRHLLVILVYVQIGNF